MKVVTNSDDYMTDFSWFRGLVFPSFTVSSPAYFLVSAPGRHCRPGSPTARCLPRVGPVVPAEEDALMTFPHLIMLPIMTVVDAKFEKAVNADETTNFSVR